MPSRRTRPRHPTEPLQALTTLTQLITLMTSSVESNDNSTSSDDELGHMLAPVPDFITLARDIQNRTNHIIGTDLMEARHFREFFGTSLVVVEKVWALLENNFLLPDGCSPKHLLWALHFMKVYPKQSVGCSTVGAIEGAVDPKTHRKWVWAFIEAIAEVQDEVVSTQCLNFFNYNIFSHTTLQPQIVFESRLGSHDLLNDCTMTVDGTDFRIPQKGPSFASHKYAGKSAVRYELGVDIIAGNLVWSHGPFPAGLYNDIKIFNLCLRHWLEPGERVEADEGYRGHADKVKGPGNDVSSKNSEMQGRVRARHETLNGRLKNWGILNQVFRHDVRLHGMVFGACAVLTQLTIENGEPLFEVEYYDW